MSKRQISISTANPRVVLTTNTECPRDCIHCGESILIGEKMYVIGDPEYLHLRCEAPLVTKLAKCCGKLAKATETKEKKIFNEMNRLVEPAPPSFWLLLLRKNKPKLLQRTFVSMVKHYKAKISSLPKNIFSNAEDTRSLAVHVAKVMTFSDVVGLDQSSIKNEAIQLLKRVALMDSEAQYKYIRPFFANLSQTGRVNMFNAVKEDRAIIDAMAYVGGRILEEQVRK